MAWKACSLSLLPYFLIFDFVLKQTRYVSLLTIFRNKYRCLTKEMIGLYYVETNESHNKYNNKYMMNLNNT